MALSDKLKEKIAIEVIRTLVSRFDNFPEDASNNRNAPFHKAFLSAFSDKLKENVTDIPFFVSLSSWMHGLTTTLGQSFIENVARHISQGEKREYTKERLGNLPITQTQRNHISQIMADLSTSTKSPDLNSENQLLFANYDTAIIDAENFSSDVFIEDTDSITAIEMKTVRPNSGEMKGEKRKILEGKAAFFRKFPGKHIHFYIGFPFDPTSNTPTGYDKVRFLNFIIDGRKYFALEEVLLANELWDFLSGEDNTMEQILEIINTISTAEFLSKYHLLIENSNRNRQTYKDILDEWYLISELELIENDELLKQNIENNRTLNRCYNKTAFDNKGKYNMDRYIELKEHITNRST